MGVARNSSKDLDLDANPFQTRAYNGLIDAKPSAQVPAMRRRATLTSGAIGPSKRWLRNGGI
ncbi:hypothetical protein BOSEA31B_20304 [Hyphomicrobiales bacterium]|nr:hypothetical protein BOSEA31B_20304 [Hyphomicrobiales bacterium]CAH1702322.1 hypothetical protein BOSEA1005_30194 [Hyphomicrobiales bacterium]CAI0346523.1 hypothetical protein BO1005MUT1_520035 [Hyphomicrobiales bacterium]